MGSRGLVDRIVEMIGAEIVSGHLMPDRRLPIEADWCVELGVSRTVLREAVSVLASKGLIETKPRVGGLGHRHQAVIDAIVAQLNTLGFAPPLHGTNPMALKLTELLLQVAPEGVAAVKLPSGGSEATEAAMKLARQYHRQTGHPRKYKILSRYGGYHGATMGALSASGGWERKSIFKPLGVGHPRAFAPLLPLPIRPALPHVAAPAPG